MSNRDQIEEIKTKLDIANIVLEYVPTLKKSGRNHFGLCPFHQEKTPSFSVNNELGLYKCFGCGEGGDVINFIQQLERVDFQRALEIAAKKAGVKLKRTYSQADKKVAKERARLLEANELAAKYFHYMLMKHDSGEKCRIYVKGRGLKKQEVVKFMIGFAPEGFENLKTFLSKKGFSHQELTKWGLLVSKNGKIYDKFRNRLMFPIYDNQGELVGFSGRQIEKNDFGPKYLNSPETLVYKKSETLYGLFQAKDTLRKTNYAILVEGNIDILSSHMAGVENIMAPLGTALTDQQVKLIRRYVDTVYFALDTDLAGEKALVRGLELIENNELKAKALDLGEYQDVDELIQQGGGWKKTIKNAQPVVQHLMERFKVKYDLNTAEGKSSYTKSIMTFIAKLNDDVEKVHYLNELSSVVRTDLKVLEREMNKSINVKVEKHKKEDVVIKKDVEIEKNSFLEKYLISLIYSHRDWKDSLDIKNILKLFQSEKLIKIVNLVMSKESSREIEAELSVDEKILFEELVLYKSIVFEEEKHFIEEVKKLSGRISEERIKNKLKFLDDPKILQELAEERRKLLR